MEPNQNHGPTLHPIKPEEIDKNSEEIFLFNKRIGKIEHLD